MEYSAAAGLLTGLLSEIDQKTTDLDVKRSWHDSRRFLMRVVGQHFMVVVRAFKRGLWTLNKGDPWAVIPPPSPRTARRAFFPLGGSLAE